MEMKNVYHGHLVVSRFDENGWEHELFSAVNARREGSGYAWDSPGASLGKFNDLSKAIAEAKRRNPPEPQPTIERVIVEEEK